MPNPLNRRLLKDLPTPFGPRTFYNSVSYCNRCGCCRQDCPSYRIFLQEPYSPRGRNRFIRLVLENKLNLTDCRAQAEQIAASCTLCGKCAAACAGQISTAQHVLQLRRMLGKRLLPRTPHALLCLRRTAPRLFSLFIRMGLLVRRTGFLRVLRALHLLPAWLNHADELLPAHIPALQAALRQRGLTPAPAKPDLIYLPSLEAAFFAPDTAAAVCAALKQRGTPCVWTDTPSGLFSFVYEPDVRRARLQVLRLMRRHKTAGRLPLITDSIEVFLFLKQAPALFTVMRLQQAARNFAACVHFAADFCPPTTPQKTGKICLDTGALLWRQDAVFERAKKNFIDVCGQNFVEFPYTAPSVAPAGFVLVNGPLAHQMGLACVRTLAREQVTAVVTLSVSAQLELRLLLKKYYSGAQARYWV